MDPGHVPGHGGLLLTLRSCSVSVVTGSRSLGGGSSNHVCRLTFFVVSLTSVSYLPPLLLLSNITSIIKNGFFLG